MWSTKKIASAGAAVSLFMALAAGCGSSGTTAIKDSAGSTAAAGADSKPVKITFWDSNAGPNRTPYYQELIKRFQEKNPNITVEYVGLPSTSAKQKYDIAISSGGLPDVGDLAQFYISDFSLKGAVLPLDKYFEKWEEKDQIPKTVLDSVRQMAPDNKLYLVPNTNVADMLWYRSDWFKAKGTAEPRSWDDFFKAAQSFTDTSTGQFGFSVRGGPGSVSQLTSMLYSYSGIDHYFDDKGKATINDPKHVEFLTKYAALYKKYTPESDITNGYKEMVAAFDSGKAAMIQHNLGSFGEHSKTLTPDQFAGTLLPKSVSGKQLLVSGGQIGGFGMFKDTKNPEAAWKFIAYLTSAEGQTYLNQNTGQMPVNMTSLKSDAFSKIPAIKIVSDILADSNTVVMNIPSYLPDYFSNLTKLEPDFQKVLLGQLSPQDYLNEWAAMMEKSKAEYDKNIKK